jgi:hypothetical protein
MSDIWPDDAGLDDVFDQALQPKVAPFVLVVPDGTYDEGPEAVARWVRANDPGYPIVVVPQKQSSEAWRRQAQKALHLGAGERARHHQEWLAAHGHLPSPP